MKKEIKAKIMPANGVKGCLLDIGGTPVFRVYDNTDKSKFIDYEIAHCDLQVTIDDTDAYFYNNMQGLDILDHSPATLGYKIK